MYQIQFLTLIIAFLYLVYDTEVIPWYLKFLNLKFLKISEYFEFKKSSPINMGYLEFLAYQSSLSLKYTFLTTLLSCSTCISFWIVLIGNFLCNLGWQKVGYELILIWVGYPLLKYLIEKLYERK